LKISWIKIPSGRWFLKIALYLFRQFRETLTGCGAKAARHGTKVESGNAKWKVSGKDND